MRFPEVREAVARSAIACREWIGGDDDAGPFDHGLDPR
jgi:hypothetical protein